jgi:XTP/dITP diphosphohydrolase
LAPDERRARFCTVAVAVYPDGRRLVAEGATEGRISPEAAGSGGFGYDPVFVPDAGDGRTFAQMAPAEKHAISHRGRAFRALAAGIIASGGASK